VKLAKREESSLNLDVPVLRAITIPRRILLLEKTADDPAESVREKEVENIKDVKGMVE